MTFIKALGRWFSELREVINGKVTVVDITPPRTQLESLVGSWENGYTLTFYCKETIHLLKNSRWWVADSKVKSYTVFVVITGGQAPPALEAACQVERTFPPLLASWESSSNQKQAAIEAYLDMVLEDLRLFEEGKQGIEHH